jgi:hypothetical protein
MEQYRDKHAGENGQDVKETKMVARVMADTNGHGLALS